MRATEQQRNEWRAAWGEATDGSEYAEWIEDRLASSIAKNKTLTEAIRLACQPPWPEWRIRYAPDTEALMARHLRAAAETKKTQKEKWQ